MNCQICGSLSNAKESLARFGCTKVLQNLLQINATHDVPFRTKNSQMNQSVLAHGTWETT